MVETHPLTVSVFFAVVSLFSLTMCAGGDVDRDAPVNDGSETAEDEQSLQGMLDGPEGPDDPLWYEPLRDMDCSNDHLVASRGQPIPMAGYLLCEAVATNDEFLWSQGAEALSQAPAPRNCWEQEAVTALQRLVDAHEERPEATLVVEEQPGYACELVLESLGSPMVPGIVAAELPVSMCGGAPIFLHGNLEYVEEGTIRSVRVGDRNANVLSGNGGLFFRAPASEAPGLVAVSVAESEWPVQGVTYLNYAAPAGACPTIPPPVGTETGSPVEG